MTAQFSEVEQVENFLSSKGVSFVRLSYYSPVSRSDVPYWKVQIGVNSWEVYDLLEWANLIYAGRRVPRRISAPASSIRVGTGWKSLASVR